MNYSIIIPHKNCTSLLERCIASIPNRDDLEVIIVDDNSDKEKVSFDNFPGLNRPNTKVIFTKEGRGAGYARNVGMKHAVGRWYLFIDADDYFCENFLTALDDYCESKYDIVFFRTTSIYPETGEIAMRHIHDNKYIDEAINKNNYTFLKYQRTSPVSKMVRASLVKGKNIWFDEVYVANDAMFSIKSSHYANSIYADNRTIYVITVNKGSLEYTFSKDILITRINVDFSLNKFFKANKIKQRICAFRYIYQLRRVSIYEFIIYSAKYIVSHPIDFVIDIISIYRQKKSIAAEVVNKNKSFIKIEK